MTVINPLPWLPHSNLLPTPKKWKKLASVPSYYEFNEIKVFSPKSFLIPKISENYHSDLMTLRLQSFVTKLNKSLHFDAINTHWIYPDATSMSKIAHSLSIAHISTGLGSDININLQAPKIKTKIIERFYNDAHITVVSGNLKEKFIEQNIDTNKIDIMLNGVDHHLFPILNKHDCRNKLKIIAESDSIVISYVGRLSKEKNLYTLIKAIDILKKNISKIYLYIIGDGPE